MRLFKINQDITYEASSVVDKNCFLNMPAEKTPVPKYTQIHHMLPSVIWEGHDDVIQCYDFAWRTAFSNLRAANENANFVSNYIDTAFNGFLFMWDSSFIAMFGKYGSRAFNFQKTLDNFYSHQHKDGFICRELCENEPGEQFSRHDPSSTGPNILPWAEWEYFCQTGDRNRLEKVFYPLLSYHLWLKKHRTWRDGTYWSTGWGCGMDNQPRLDPGYHVAFSHGHMVWVDTCLQQVLSAKLLLKIADTLGIDENAYMLELQNEISSLTSIINDELWHEDDAFYYDLLKNGQHNCVKSIGAYWALLADIIPQERLDRFVAHLNNDAEFKRPCPIPTLSADHPAYQPDGGYWRGGVWAPTNYMVLKGLEKHGYDQLAYEIARNCLDNVVAVFCNDATLYENYAPETASKGQPARKDFVGWSGLFPVSILFEYVFGIRSHSCNKKITWNIHLLEKHGINNYPLNNNTVNILCQERTSQDDEPRITVSCAEPIELEIRYANKTKIIKTTAGNRTY